MSRRPVSVTLTVTAPKMRAVREWLSENDYRAPRAADAALWDYAYAVLVTNSDWDSVPLAVRREEPPPK